MGQGRLRGRFRLALSRGAWREQPALRVFLSHVPAAERNAEARTLPSLRLFEQGGEASGARRLDDEPEMSVQQTHCADDAFVADADDFVHRVLHAAHREWNRLAYRDAVGDGIRRRGGYGLLRGEREAHRLRALRHHADDVRGRFRVPEPRTDTRDERSVAEWNEHRFRYLPGLAELQRDRSCTFGDFRDAAVLDVVGVGGCSKSARGVFGRIEVRAILPHLCAEVAHCGDFQWIRIARGEDDDRALSFRGRARETLAKVAGRRAHDGPAVLHACDDEVRSASLERTDGIQRLDLEEKLALECAVER